MKNANESGEHDFGERELQAIFISSRRCRWILDTPAGQKQRTKTAQRPDDFLWNRALDHDHHGLALKLVKENVTFILTDDIAFWHSFQIALESQSMDLIDFLWPYAEKRTVLPDWSLLEHAVEFDDIAF